MSEEEKHPAKLAAAKLFDAEDVWYTEEETAEIIRREYAKSQWRAIESAPKDKKVFFWVMLKEGRKALMVQGAPHRVFCKFGGWSSVLKATHWRPDLPNPPSLPEAPSD